MHGSAVGMGRDGPVTVVALAGEIDMTNAADTASLGMLAIHRTDVSVVEFDMAAVTFIDSSGIGALVAVHHAAQANGVTVRITGAPASVTRVLSIAGLADTFGVNQPN